MSAATAARPTVRAPRVRYVLTRAARDEIRYRSELLAPELGRRVTIAGYVRHFCPDGEWGGDACGCTDSRCAGSGWHHDPDEPCGCLPVLLDEYVAAVLCAAAGGHDWSEPAGNRYNTRLWRHCRRQPCRAALEVAEPLDNSPTRAGGDA